MPRAYLTTFSAMLSLRGDRTLPIWYSTISGQRTPLLFDTEGVATSVPDQLPWRKMPLNPQGVVPNLLKDDRILMGGEVNNGVITPELAVSSASTREGATSLAQIALNLQPLEKRILDEIAAHPLLTRDEIALLLQATRRRVQPGLTKMTALKLIEAHDERYLIAPKGQKYLALAAGFGNAVQRYARARGWGKGFGSLMRHWVHTQEENKFFLHLAEIAQDHGHTLTWLSELESRLYYEAGQRRHSFLPDGRGTYIAGDARFEFALEIDRSGSPQKRFRGKLAEYEACIGSNVLRSEGIELLRVLVVTKSWERAESWRRAAQSVRVQFPIFVTTFDRLYASGADACIWWRIDLPNSPESAAESPKQHCFECFANQE
jgi:hypothetical protein